MPLMRAHHISTMAMLLERYGMAELLKRLATLEADREAIRAEASTPSIPIGWYAISEDNGYANPLVT